MNVSFNPFNRDLEEIEPSHLAILQDVAEGWYVEYKSELLPVKGIAKSLAAFANHYGGWIFYGIEQAPDGSNRAGSFPGLSNQEVSLLIERLRNAAKDVVNPDPYYEYAILNGPCAEVGLLDERAIVAVAVPSGPDSPYVHNDGRIYRRIADSSDPVPETDRFILDHLWQRRQLARERLASFLEKEPILSQGEDDVSFVDLFFLPDPLGASGQRSSLTFSEFSKLMNEPSTAEVVKVGFENIYTMPDGFMARHVSTNDPYNLVMTWQHYRNGFSIVTIPFSSTDIANLHDVELWLRGYEQKDAMLSLIHKGNHTSGTLLDINLLLCLAMASVEKHRRLMEAGGIKGPLYAKVALRNVWRRTPFLDTNGFIHFVSRYGLPVIQYDYEFSPPGKSFESLILVPDTISVPQIEQEDVEEVNEGVADEIFRLILQQTGRAAHIFGHIFNALGLSWEAVHTNDSKEEWSVLSAAQRALVVDANRSNNLPRRALWS